MDSDRPHLPKLLAHLAWLLPLASFALIVLFGPRMGKAGKAGRLRWPRRRSRSCVLSLIALFGVWLPKHGPLAPEHHAEAPAARRSSDRREPKPHAAGEQPRPSDAGGGAEKRAGPKITPAQ